MFQRRIVTRQHRHKLSEFARKLSLVVIFGVHRFRPSTRRSVRSAMRLLEHEAGETAHKALATHQPFRRETKVAAADPLQSAHAHPAAAGEFADGAAFTSHERFVHAQNLRLVTARAHQYAKRPDYVIELLLVTGPWISQDRAERVEFRKGRMRGTIAYDVRQIVSGRVEKARPAHWQEANAPHACGADLKMAGKRTWPGSDKARAANRAFGNLPIGRRTREKANVAPFRLEVIFDGGALPFASLHIKDQLIERSEAALKLVGRREEATAHL